MMVAMAKLTPDDRDGRRRTLAIPPPPPTVTHGGHRGPHTQVCVVHIHQVRGLEYLMADGQRHRKTTRLSLHLSHCCVYVCGPMSSTGHVDVHKYTHIVLTVAYITR